MKILNVVSHIDPSTGGGNVERTVQLSRALLSADVEVAILTTDVNFNGILPIKSELIEWIILPTLLSRFYIPKISWSNIRKIVKSVDCIHMIGHWSILNAVVYLAAKAENKKYILCPAGALVIYGRSKFLKHLYNILIGNKVVRNANACIAVTDAERVDFNGYGVSDSVISVIPNGINPEDYHIPFPSKDAGCKNIPLSPYILFVGRVNSIKGPDLLLEAFLRGYTHWPDINLVIAGPDGGLLQSLMERAGGSKYCNNIHFPGFISGAEKSEFYKNAKLVVIPSRHEAMSIVVLEAAIFGVPVLLTDACGFDIIENIGGGLVVPPTIEGIEMGLIKLLSNRGSLVTHGSSLKEFVLKGYTWKNILHKYLLLFQEMGKPLGDHT